MSDSRELTQFHVVLEIGDREHQVGRRLPLSHPLIVTAERMAKAIKLSIRIVLKEDRHAGAFFGAVEHALDGEIWRWGEHGSWPEPGSRHASADSSSTWDRLIADAECELARRQAQRQDEPSADVDVTSSEPTEVDPMERMRQVRLEQMLYWLARPITDYDLSEEVTEILTDPAKGGLYYLWQIYELTPNDMEELLVDQEQRDEVQVLLDFLGVNVNCDARFAEQLRDRLPLPPDSTDFDEEEEAVLADHGLTAQQVSWLNEPLVQLSPDPIEPGLDLNTIAVLRANAVHWVWQLCLERLENYRELNNIGPKRKEQINALLDRLELGRVTAAHIEALKSRSFIDLPV